MTINENFDSAVNERIKMWSGGEFDRATEREIEQLLRESPEQLVDRFDKRLDFGTGGMRGLMGVGTNRMNIYTVGFAAQGLANFLKKKYGGQTISAIISCDTRHMSPQFSRHVAQIFAANDIQAHLLEGFCPIPLLSFGCRKLKCQAAVMITASHNRREYSGFKVYGEDGSQVVAPDDREIVNEVALLQHPKEISLAPWGDGRIMRNNDEVIACYFRALDQINPDPLIISKAEDRGLLCKVIYTALHGAGATATPKALRNWGFRELHLISEQMLPDGDFPTVNTPNPEDRSAMALGVQCLLERKADLLIANDPDSDRMGAVVRDGDRPRFLTGNEIGALIFFHLCSTLAEKGHIPPSAALIKSWVTSDLLRAIADHFAIKTFEVPTGFKFIAATIRRWKDENLPWYFLFGAEESLGYLTGDHARDKDGVLAACLLAQAAQRAKLANKTLCDHLEDLYRRFGLFCERNFSIEIAQNRAGTAQVAMIMERLNEHPPLELGGVKITPIAASDDASGLKVQSKCPDMIIWQIAERAKAIIRPSGTEPKLKFYLFNSIALSPDGDVALAMRLAADQLELLAKELKALIETVAPN